MQGDVSKLDDLNKIYERIKKESDHLDILFVNAGVIKDSQLDSITEENFDYMFNINCKGVPFTVQKALPIFKGSGAIVLNASISSMVRV
jgi:NADP-dependent 3-hydroxy acid dehydrogenase YdfG